MNLVPFTYAISTFETAAGFHYVADDKLEVKLAIIDKSSNNVAGVIYLRAYVVSERAIEIGYGIGPDFRGRGYATEAVDAGLRYMKGVFGSAYAYAVVHESNLGSISVLLKNGFVKHAPVDRPPPGRFYYVKTFEEER